MTTKTNTAGEPVKLSLTSRAKSPRVAKTSKKAPVAKKAPKGLKEMLVASIEQVAAQIPAGPGLDGDAGVPAAQIGEPVSPAKAKAPTAKAKAKKVAKAAVLQAEADELGLTNIRGIVGHAAATYARLLIAGPVTPRDLATATGLDTRQRCKVDRALGKAGWKLHHKRNPERDRADRDTANLYWLSRDAG